MHPDTCKNAKKILISNAGSGSQVLILLSSFAMNIYITNIGFFLCVWTYIYIYTHIYV